MTYSREEVSHAKDGASLRLSRHVMPGRAQQKTRKDIHGDPLPAGDIARLGTIKLRPGAPILHVAFSPAGFAIYKSAAFIVRTNAQRNWSNWAADD